MKRTVRETLFFITFFALFFLAVKLYEFWCDSSKKINPNIPLIIVSILFTLIIIVVYYFGHLHFKEDFWDVSPFAKCKGGPYMWQGDSENARMCRSFAETPEGRCGISSYDCRKGYDGQPMLPFIYTPLSNDKWANERCQDKPTCPCTQTPYIK